MARTYDVNGVKTYLIAAIFLFVIGAWHVYDGWVEQDYILEKHPKVEELSFVEGGKVANIYCQVGDKVKAGRVIADLEQTDERAGKKLIAKRKITVKSKKKSFVECLDFVVGDVVEAEQNVGKLIVKDHYYLYNKVTGVVACLAGLVCLVVHFRVR